MGTRCADRAIPFYLQKMPLTSHMSGGRSAGIVGLRAKSHEDFVLLVPRQFNADSVSMSPS
jgi:hypothetical protein